MYMKQQIIQGGKPLAETNKVLIMVHGRGGSAEDILSLADHLPVSEFALLAPQAENHSWYPASFMAPAAVNEPYLTKALLQLEDSVRTAEAAGVPTKNIYLLGFSQGACLTLEFATRNAKQYGGIIALTGGLVGDQIYRNRYNGNFNGTPIFIGSANPDPHVPVERVHDTEIILKEMNAAVTVKIYPGMGHTINQDELTIASGMLEK